MVTVPEPSSSTPQVSGFLLCLRLNERTSAWGRKERVNDIYAVAVGPDHRGGVSQLGAPGRNTDDLYTEQHSE